MLRTNLATRPFYNERAVHLLLGLVAVLLVALTVFQAARIVALSGRQTGLRAQIVADEARAAELTRQAAAIRAGVDAKELEAVVGAASEANTIIDQRTFSWTEVFNLIERTLPADVMLTSVRPEIRERTIGLTLTVLARNVEAIDAFIERLEATGTFQHLLAQQEERTDEGMFRALLRGRYVPADAGPAPPGTDATAGAAEIGGPSA